MVGVAVGLTETILQNTKGRVQHCLFACTHNSSAITSARTVGMVCALSFVSQSSSSGCKTRRRTSALQLKSSLLCCVSFANNKFLWGVAAQPRGWLASPLNSKRNPWFI